MAERTHSFSWYFTFCSPPLAYFLFIVKMPLNLHLRAWRTELCLAHVASQCSQTHDMCVKSAISVVSKISAAKLTAVAKSQQTQGAGVSWKIGRMQLHEVVLLDASALRLSQQHSKRNVQEYRFQHNPL